MFSAVCVVQLLAFIVMTIWSTGSEIKIDCQLQYQCRYDDNVCQKEQSGSMIGHTCMQLTENSFAKPVIDTA